MTEEEPKKKKEESKEDNEVCLKEYGFSLDTMNEMYDALDQARDMIENYSDTTGSFSDETRQKIASLSIESDLLLIDINEMYVKASDFITASKKRELNIDGKIDEREVNEFKQKLQAFRTRFDKLHRDLKGYIELIKSQGAYMP